MANSALIDDLLKQYAENPRRVFARLANEYRKTGELDAAIQICRSFVPQLPTYISGHIVLGQALYESGQLDEARTTFETALGLDPENLIALRQLGDIALASGDQTAARDWYRRLLEVDPQNEEIAEQLREMEASLAAAASPVAEEVAPPEVSWSDINPEHSAAEAARSDVPLDGGAPSSTEPVTVDALDFGFPPSPSPVAPPPPPPLIDLVPTADAWAGMSGARSREEPSAASEITAAHEPAAASWMASRPAPAAPPTQGGAQPIESTPAGFVTETMADLYLKQGFRDRGLAIYRQLVAERPHDHALRDRLAQLEHPTRAGGDASRGRSARAFFGLFAARRPPAETNGAEPSVASPYSPAPEPLGLEIPVEESSRAQSSLDEPTVMEPVPVEPSSEERSSIESPSADVGMQGEATLDISSYAPGAEPDAPPGADDVSPGGASEPATEVETAGLDGLFAGREVSAGDDERASALAGAFSGDYGGADLPLTGEPARAASDELSLQNVFRDGRARPDGERGDANANVSFDEFFARRETDTEGTEPAAPTDEQPPAAPAADDGSSEQDLELFHAWLDGLTK